MKYFIKRLINNLKNRKSFNRLIIFAKNLYYSPKLISLQVVFDKYAPYSGGNSELISKLTKNTINGIFKSIGFLSSQLHGRETEIFDLENIPLTEEELKSIEKLKTLFVKYKSDKSTNHEYHLLYGKLLSKTKDIQNILEIGIGTNNTENVSHMGKKGTPGASLRAFADFCPNSKVFGADFDKKILFNEKRIETYYVDQTNNDSLDRLCRSLKEKKFDLIIDDGLHSPDANINTLRFATKLIKKGGSIVIEDINPKAIDIWTSIGYLFPREEYSCQIIKSMNDLLFLVKKL
jgi:SAM-dependent methyltransferase